MMPSAAVRPRRAVDMPLVAVSNVLPCFANWPVARLARLIPDVNSAESRPSTTRSAPTTLEAMCGYSNKKRRPESRPVRQWLFVRSAFQLHLRGERWIAVGIVRIEFCRRCFCGDSWLIFAGFLRAPKISGNGNSHQRQRAESSAENTSELQSLMRISYAVFCLKKKKKPQNNNTMRQTYTQ